MASNAIEQLVALLQKNPALVSQLTQMVNMDEAVKLVKSKGLEIAKAELQEYITKNLLKNVGAGDLLGGLASGLAKGGSADILGGILGGKK